MRICAICNKKFEADDPAVLYVSKYGTARVVCKECETLLDAASDEGDMEARREARGALAKLSFKMNDPEAMQVLRDVLDGKSSAEQTEQDILDEEAFKETLDEEETESSKGNPFLDYLVLAIATLALVGFAVWLFFLR